MRLVCVVIPLILIGIVGIQEVSACSCAISTIEEEFENTEVVFSGLATNIIHVDGIYHTNFLVTDKWKNIEQDIIQINIYSNDSTCGVNFKINKKYVIFAGEYSGDDPKKSGLYTSACTYTQSVEHAEINTLNFLENNRIFFQSVMPPLKQISTGIHVKDVTCKEGLDLIFKSSDNSPACVRSSTAEKLIQRGWTEAGQTISEEVAISLIKKQYPKLRDFPNDKFPQKIIRSEKSSEGWHVMFETLGSGIPIIEAKCFLVDDAKTVTQIGEYKPKGGEMLSTISVKTCEKPETKTKLIEQGWTLSIPKSQLFIKTGTYAGECLGYCVQDFIITPEKIVYSKSGWEIDGQLPEQSKEVSMSETEWQKLIDLVDFQKFNSLPDRIGCPGCTDNLVEWIEISDDKKTKKIEFEPEDIIPEIEELIMMLREIRNTVESSIDKT